MKDGQCHLLVINGPYTFVRGGYEERCEYMLKHTLAKLSCNASSILDIVVHCAGLNANQNLDFNSIQSILARLYGMVCDVCSNNNIDPASPNYVNVRIFAVASEADDDESLQRQQLHSEIAHNQAKQAGPVFTEQALANSDRQWASIAYDAQGSAQNLIESWMKTDLLANAEIEKVQLDEATKGITSHGSSDKYNTKDEVRLHKTVAVGGTFDNLHEGHKLLLSATALVLGLNATAEPTRQRLIVGITGEDLLKNKKYAEMLESWEDRQKSVFKFLSSVLSLTDADAAIEPERRDDPGPNGKTCIYRLPRGPTIECVEIQDPFGPTITDESVSALALSGETRAGGGAINEKRTEKGWAPLEVFEVDVLGPKDSPDLKDKISSTEKRRKLYEAQAKAN